MSDHPGGGCLCDTCCEAARHASPQYAQQYGLYSIGHKGNGLGNLGRKLVEPPPALWRRTLLGRQQ